LIKTTAAPWELTGAFTKKLMAFFLTNITVMNDAFGQATVPATASSFQL
jgi:hypothetical protein